MSGIIPVLTATGQTAYFTFMDMLTGQIWNGAAMEVYNSSHWGNYAIASAEQSGSGRYIVAVPGGLPAGNYWVAPYLETVNPGTPTLGDTPLDLLRLGWDGANIIDIGSGLNVTEINGNAVAAANLALSAATFITGTAAAGTLSNTQMTTNLGVAVANLLAGRVLYFTSGANAKLAVLITGYAVTGGKLTFIGYNNLPAPSAPSAGDTFIIF